MLYRQRGTRSRFQIGQSPAHSQEQAIQDPMFEASAQPPTAQSEPTPETASPRALSPFELQQRTVRQTGSIPSASPSQGVPQSTRQAASSVSQPTAPIQQYPVGFGAAAPSVPAAQPYHALASRFGTPQTYGPMAASPQPNAPQTSVSPTIQGGTQGQVQQAAPSESVFWAEPSTQTTPRVPPLDIHDAGESLEIEVELPGVSKKNIRLVSKPQGLALSATAEERKTEDLVQSERGQRVFQRSIPVGFEVDPQQVSARFENGVLTVSIPKEAVEGGNAIEIK